MTNEPSIAMCLVVIMVMLMVLMMEMVHFVENSKVGGHFGAGDDFLGVDLVETIDKRLILCLDTTTNR